jgi:hypothetical protein
LGEIASREAKECLSCYNKRRSLKPQKQVEDRIRIEDQFLADAQRALKQYGSRPPVLRPATKKGSKATDHEMVALVSDTHYPEVVDPETAMGLVYNADICEKRLAHIRDTIIRYKDLRTASYPIGKLTIPFLGDMLSGDIHEELEVTNQFPMSESLVKLAYLIDDFCRSLAGEFPEVEAIFMPGNHPRLTKKPRHKARWNNWDYVLGHFVAALAGKNYKVQVPKDIIFITTIAQNWRVGLVHGDGVKSASFAGIPWYGMKSRRDAIQALLRHLGQPGIDYLLMGHFHQLLYWQGTDCDLIINGAVKGGDEYSIDTRHASTDPVQALLTFHPNHGITDLSRINLKEIV